MDDTSRLNRDEAERLRVFKGFKQRALNKNDLSLKGSIDTRIQSLVEIINENEYYYTTSTCSGRITLLEKPHNNAGNKKGSVFHLNSHEPVDHKQIFGTMKTFIERNDHKTADSEGANETCLWLKFEPFIIHAQCFNLDKARCLLNTALQAGCRNSGITLGNPDKFMVAARSTSSMEVPVYCIAKFVTPNEDFIKFLCDECNRRLLKNFERLSKLEEALKTSLL